MPNMLAGSAASQSSQAWDAPINILKNAANKEAN